MKKSKIKIVEVGPRDGLQNEQQKLPINTRLEFVKRLSRAGVNHIEIGAFVSPKWVPQMVDTDKLASKIFAAQKRGLMPKAKYSALVPNEKGMQLAMQTQLREVAVFGACSEAFSQKNINCSISESFNRFKRVISMAQERKIKVRGYLSTAFGCPYEGKVPQSRVLRLVERMLMLGVYEISIGDTIGVATPKQVTELLQKLKGRVNPKQIAMHFHDTRGTALANVHASLINDIRIFDSSLGGLGGCPYAKGASGNLATEDLVYMLEGMGLRTGIDLSALLPITNWMQKQIGRELPARVSQAGLPIKGTL